MTDERTKLPPRRVSADGLAIELDGETYYPHKGDWVEFRRLGRVGQVLGLAERGEEETSAQYATRLRDDLRVWLAQKIVRWHWTDDAGETFPEYPTAEDLDPLVDEELFWLMARARGLESDDDRKNGSSSSTSRSTAKKGRSRKSGS